MLSWRARGDEKLASEWRHSDGGCFCHSPVSECISTAVSDCVTSVTESPTVTVSGTVTTTVTESATAVTGSRQQQQQQQQQPQQQVPERRCRVYGSWRGPKPMVVVQVGGATDAVSRLAVARSHSPLFSQHRPYPLYAPSAYSSSSSSSSVLTTSPSSSSSSPLSCLRDAVPMVALECELPLSGRLSPPADLSRSLLSPPADLSRSMSAPFLSSIAAGGAAAAAADTTSIHHHLHSGAADSVHRLNLGGDSTHVSSSEHLSGSVAQVHTYMPNGASRTGSKRKLPRREDAICEDEDVDVVEGQDVDHRSLSMLNGISRDCCGKECDGEIERKRRRLHSGEEEEGFVDMDFVVEHGSVNGVEEGLRIEVMDEQRNNCVVDECLDTASISTSSTTPTAETEVSVSVVVEESPDSVVEVDVVGDEGEDTMCSSSLHNPCPSSDLCHQDGAADTEHCSSEEASSEDGEDDAFLMAPRPPRISPFLNTPKQRKEERRKILKMSIHKMRAVEDPEHFLRRSVLINNTMKRLQRELREEKMRNNPRRSCYGQYRRASSVHYDVLNNSYLLHDEPFAISENDRITDDMTDALVTRLEATSSPVAPTPSPSPCPAEEPDTLSMAFPAVSSSEPSTWSSDVSSTVPELSNHLTPADCMPEPALTSPEELMSSISHPTTEAVSTTSGADMASTSSPSSSSPSSTCPSLFEGVLSMPGLARDSQSPGASCSSQSQREKQLYADIDTVFNNLIHALGDS